MTDLKPGFKTSEFWLAVLPYVLMFVKQFSGVQLESEPVVNGILGLVAVVTSVSYVVSRFKLKSQQIEGPVKEE